MAIGHWRRTPVIVATILSLVAVELYAPPLWAQEEATAYLDPATGAVENIEHLSDLKGAVAFQQGRASAEAVGGQAVDEFTLRVELEEPVGHFLHLLAYSVTMAIPRHVVTAQGAAWAQPEHLVTHGPFRLEAWKPDEAIVLVRVPNYVEQFSGNL